MSTERDDEGGLTGSAGKLRAYRVIVAKEVGETFFFLAKDFNLKSISEKSLEVLMFSLGGEFDSCFSRWDRHNVVRLGWLFRRLMDSFSGQEANFPPVWQVSCEHIT